MRLPSLVATAGFMLFASLSHAQAPGSAAPEAANHPARGMTMARVESAFGAPSNRAAAVGQPPITRWEYPGFVVYFEHSHVIHTVTVR
jgi:hypothetical protein